MEMAELAIEGPVMWHDAEELRVEQAAAGAAARTMMSWTGRIFHIRIFLSNVIMFRLEFL